MIKVYVIAHGAHFRNWLHINELNGIEFVLLRRESDMDGLDPATTFVLPLFRNGRHRQPAFEDLYSQVSEVFHTFDVRKHVHEKEI